MSSGEDALAGAKYYKWGELAEDAPIALLTRKRVIGEHALIARVVLQVGCDVKTHSHDNEQISCVLSGKVRFGVGAEGSAERREVVVSGGEVLHLPKHVPHSAFALEESVILDIFSPPSLQTGIDLQKK